MCSVAQARPLLEHFVRHGQDQWLLAASVSSLTGHVTLASVQCTLSLTNVYERVVWPADDLALADEA